MGRPGINLVLWDTYTGEKRTFKRQIDVANYLTELLHKTIYPATIKRANENGYIIGNRYQVYPEGGEPVKQAKRGPKTLENKYKEGKQLYERFHPDVIVMSSRYDGPTREQMNDIIRRNTTKNFKIVIVMGESEDKKDETRWNIEIYYRLPGLSFQEQIEEMKKKIKNL